MRTSLILVSVLVMFSGTRGLHAQAQLPSAPWKTTTVAVSPDSFPIGGFNFGQSLFIGNGQSGFDPYQANGLKELGLNCNYGAGFGAGYEAPGALNTGSKFLTGGDDVLAAPYMTGGLKLYPGLPIYETDAQGNWLLDANGNPIPYWQGEGGGLAQEFRYFLASNEALYTDVHTGTKIDQFGLNLKNLYDCETQRWDGDAGVNAYVSNNWDGNPTDAQQQQRVNNGECLIHTGTLPSDGYLLKNLQIQALHPASVSPSDMSGWNLPLSTVSSTAVCDFIYRIKPSDVVAAGATASTPLFTVEYYYRKIEWDGSQYNESLVLQASQDITLGPNNPGSYDDYINTPHPKEPVNILWFPKNDPGSLTGYTSKQYAVLNNVIPVTGSGLQSTDWNPGSPTVGMWKYVGIECRLKAYAFGGATVPIYVRGLRVRSQLADDILTGKHDQEMINEFQHAKSNLMNLKNPDNGTTAWQNTVAFAQGQELAPYQERVVAYVDSFCYKYTGKHLLQYTTGGDDYFRTIYEDQVAHANTGSTMSVTSAIAPPFQSESAFFLTSMPAGVWNGGSPQWENFCVNWNNDPNFATNFNGHLPIPMDALPYELRHLKNSSGTEIFTMFGEPITGSYNRLGLSRYELQNWSDPTKAWSTDPPNSNDLIVSYDNYTRIIQARLGVMPSLDEALKAYPDYTTPARWGKWYANAPTITDMASGRNGGSKSLVYDGCLGGPDPFSGHYTLAANLSNSDIQSVLMWMENTSATLASSAIASPYPGQDLFHLDKLSLSFDEQIENIWNGSLKGCGVWPSEATRPQLATEIRASSWVQMCAGAKGIFFNSIGSDGGGDIGIEFPQDLSNLPPDYDLSGSSGLMNNVPLSDCSSHLLTPDNGDGLAHLPDRVIFRDGVGWVPAPLYWPGTTTPLTDDNLQTFITGEENQTTNYGYYNFYKGLPNDNWLTTNTFQCSSTNPNGDGKGTVTTSNPNHFSCTTNYFSNKTAPFTMYIQIPAGDINVLNVNVTAIDADGKGVTVSQPLPPMLNQDGSQAYYPFWFDGDGSFDPWCIDHKDQFRADGSIAPPWSVYKYPNDIWAQNVWVPTFYGFKERWTGSKRVVDDLTPIANILAKLQWKFTMNLANANQYYMGDQMSDEESKYGSFNYANFKNLPINPSTMMSYLVEPNDPHTLLAPSDQNLYPDAQNTQIVCAPRANSINLDQPCSSWVVADLPDNARYQFGVFNNPGEPDAQYFIVVNRRTWPYHYQTYYPRNFSNPSPTTVVLKDPTDPSGNTTWYGAIDARRFEFQVNNVLTFTASDGSTQDWSKVTYFSVTNCRTGAEKVVSASDFLYVDLDPGEGTLLRIAPATALEVGRTNYAGIAYNNGNRTALVSPVIPPCSGAPQFRASTWEENGSIMFSLAPPAGADPGDISASALAVYSPMMSTGAIPPTPGADSGHNPSIASKTGPNGDTIAIVYSVDNFNTPVSPAADPERAVMFAYSTDQGATWNNPASNPAPYIGTSLAIAGKNSAPAVSLYYYHPNVLDVTGNGWDLMTPVITPVSDGFVIAYANNRDIHPYWVHFMGGAWVWKALRTPTPGSYNTDLRMPSLASRDDYTGQRWERIHFCYESDYGNGHSAVFYWPIEHQINTPPPQNNFRYGNFTPLGWAVEVSRGYLFCTNMHPHVAVINDLSGTSPLGLPIVTWEVTDQGFPCPPFCGGGIIDPMPNPPTHAAVRYMIAPGDNTVNPQKPTIWSEITMFHTLPNNIPQPVVRPLDQICNTAPASPFAEVAYQDTFSHQEFIARLTSPWAIYPGPYIPSTWNISRLEEYAQWGGVSLPYEQDPSEDYGSIFYRGIYPDANGLYAAKIVANPDPSYSDEVAAPMENRSVWRVSVTAPVIGGPSPCGPPIY